LFAAQDHPGGRISSVFHNGSWIETGAQWIHGQNNELWKLADQYDLLSAVTSSEGEGKKLIYRVSQEECARLQENVPYVKVHQYNPKLNGYGDNGERSLKV